MTTRTRKLAVLWCLLALARGLLELWGGKYVDVVGVLFGFESATLLILAADEAWIRQDAQWRMLARGDEETLGGTRPEPPRPQDGRSASSC